MLWNWSTCRDRVHRARNVYSADFHGLPCCSLFRHRGPTSYPAILHRGGFARGYGKSDRLGHETTNNSTDPTRISLRPSCSGFRSYERSVCYECSERSSTRIRCSCECRRFAPSTRDGRLIDLASPARSRSCTSPSIDPKMPYLRYPSSWSWLWSSFRP